MKPTSIEAFLEYKVSSLSLFSIFYYSSAEKLILTQIEVRANITTKNLITSIIQETPGRNRPPYPRDVESPNFPNQSLIFIDSPEAVTKESEGFPGSQRGRKFNSIRLTEPGRTVVTVPRILKRSDSR